MFKDVLKQKKFSRDEWVGLYDKWEAEFNAMDTDGSGGIDRPEWAAAGEDTNQ